MVTRVKEKKNIYISMLYWSQVYGTRKYILIPHTKGIQKMATKRTTNLIKMPIWETLLLRQLTHRWRDIFDLYTDTHETRGHYFHEDTTDSLTKLACQSPIMTHVFRSPIRVGTTGGNTHAPN